MPLAAIDDETREALAADVRRRMQRQVTRQRVYDWVAKALDTQRKMPLSELDFTEGERDSPAAPLTRLVYLHACRNNPSAPYEVLLHDPDDVAEAQGMRFVDHELRPRTPGESK